MKSYKLIKNPNENTSHKSTWILRWDEARWTGYQDLEGGGGGRGDGIACTTILRFRWRKEIGCSLVLFYQGLKIRFFYATCKVLLLGSVAVTHKTRQYICLYRNNNWKLNFYIRHEDRPKHNKHFEPLFFMTNLPLGTSNYFRIKKHMYYS